MRFPFRREMLVSSLALPLLLVSGPARAEEPSAEVRAAIKKGLEWMARNQNRDGHWEAMGGQYPVTMTALGGMAFLMEGSTIREGKYADRIRRAVDWLMVRSQPNGLIGNPNHPGEAGRYMYGHGFSLMFLSCVYGEEEDGERRKKLEDILTRAVQFSGKAQTSRGGWGYVSAADGNNFDEGSVTVTQLQALRAARNAGIVVPKDIIDKAVAYLEACTTPKGGVIYTYSGSGGVARTGQERPPITAAAVACSFSAGQYKSESARKWVKFCKDNIPIAKGRVAHDEYQSYYFAQCVYVLGDDRYGEMFPKEDKASWLTWSKYKDAMYPYLIDSQ